jgi:methylphosphotriester-DNA--protein-cysteine methyltransferase
VTSRDLPFLSKSLRNQTLPADTVLGSRVARRLTDANAVDTWIRSIGPNTRLSGALNLLATRSVDEAANELVSGRHLRSLVLADVGLPPKVYRHVIRLRRFAHALDAGAPLTAAGGYADQPCLTRDVSRFCGMTPARL